MLSEDLTEDIKWLSIGVFKMQYSDDILGGECTVHHRVNGLGAWGWGPWRLGPWRLGPWGLEALGRGLEVWGLGTGSLKLSWELMEDRQIGLRPQFDDCYSMLTTHVRTDIMRRCTRIRLRCSKLNGRVVSLDVTLPLSILITPLTGGCQTYRFPVTL